MKLFQRLIIGLGIFSVIVVCVVFVFQDDLKIFFDPPKSVLEIKGIGVLGDSQSDEYRGDDNRGGQYASTTLNWVEILNQKRGLNFGNWDTREEPRRTGYEYNWARSGATTTSLIESKQHEGLAQQIREGKVNVAIIYIGANDFSPYTTDGYSAIYHDYEGNHSNDKISTVTSNIEMAVQTLTQAGDVTIVVVKVPDWGRHLGVQIYYANPLRRNHVTEVVQKINERIDEIARIYHATTLDTNQFFNELTQNSNGAEVVIEGETFNRMLPSDNPSSIFLSDAIHPGTVVNGFFANYLIRHLNTHYNAQIQPFSSLEIFKIAGFR